MEAVPDTGERDHHTRSDQQRRINRASGAFEKTVWQNLIAGVGGSVMKDDQAMVLEVIGVSKHFGGLQVLEDVSFQVREREILGLIGPNGAGKSTMFNVITGVYQPNRGHILFQKKNITGLKTYQVCRRGIGRTFQLVQICPTMTALENVLVGAVYGRKGGGKHALAEALECLKLLNLLEVKDTVVAHLTYSDRKLIEIARAVSARPGLVLLDEPLAGLNPVETTKIMEVIKVIRQTREISIIWIEHKMDAVFKLCDRVVVLDYGRKIAEGLPQEIAHDKVVVEAYLGEPVD
jgi:branched-chain amino acid transport system ATP-binding protein